MDKKDMGAMHRVSADDRVIDTTDYGRHLGSGSDEFPASRPGLIDVFTVHPVPIPPIERVAKATPTRTAVVTGVGR